MEEGDYYFEPRALAVRAGTITVQITNVGPDRPHTFNVRSPGGGDIVRSGRIEVNQSGAVTFPIEEPGTYEFYCVLPGHADRGQRGALTVTR